MKFATVFTLFFAAAAQADTDYFFRYKGGNDILDHQRLRSNISIQYASPGVTLPPYNPADHFLRLTTNATACSPAAELIRVPTNPHPPPVAGYYGLSDREGVPDAFRLIYSYRLDEEGPGFRYTGWKLQRPGRGDSGETGTLLLRYPIAAGEKGRKKGWKWIAVKERNGDYDKWVPWYVKPSRANAAKLASWDYENVDLELVEAKGPVDSNAPGGVRE